MIGIDVREVRGLRGAPRLALLLLATCLAALGCPGAETGFSGEASPIQLVSTQVGGKNVYIPSTVLVVAGVPQVLSVYNTTDTPHGFRIAGLGIETVLPPGQEHAVELPALEGGRVYRIDCQLHPPHRNATLAVLPGR
jgi:hypothetical protein